MFGEVIEKELGPCPICREKVELLRDYSKIEQRYNYSIFCNNCDWTFIPQSVWNEEEIIKQWNRRVCKCHKGKSK